jgi:hypothetical protein
MSQLKRYSGRMHFAWLDTLELEEVNKIIAHLEFEDMVPVRRVQPITVEVIESLVKEPSVPKYDTMMIAVGHDSLQRGAELCSGHTVGDWQWSADRKSVTIKLARSKCHRKGGPQIILIKDYGSRSGTRLLKRHFDRNQLWGKVDHLIFPSVSKAGVIDWSKARSTAQFRSSVKSAVRAIGLDPKLFGGHSPRAGGATDLFRANVFYPNIKKFGRWKSDAALIYYRDEDAVAQAATEGFASLLHTKLRKH